jgi:polyphenol oxidase
MEIRKAGRVHYVEPALMAQTGMVSAGFTTRHEGVSRPPYNSLNLGMNTLDSPHNVEGNRSIVARAFGGSVERFVGVNQVHGVDLLVIDAPNPDYAHFQKIACDGIVTNQRGLMITVGVADCVPVLLLDPGKGVAAALHAGWKGTAAGICGKGVKAMREVFGCNPSDIVGAVGPAIGRCCYEVDSPVIAAFRSSGHLSEDVAVEKGGGKWMLDLALANREQLLAAGLSEKNVEKSDHCVSCAKDLFFSYRRDGGETGRQVGFVMLK